MGNRKLNGAIGLEKLTHVIQMSKKGNKCIVIPLDANYIVETTDKNGVIHYNLDITTWINEKADEHGRHGSIKQNLPSETYKSMDKEAAITLSKTLPYLANLKDFSAGSNETSAAASADTFNEGDDLPF